MSVGSVVTDSVTFACASTSLACASCSRAAAFSCVPLRSAASASTLPGTSRSFSYARSPAPARAYSGVGSLRVFLISSVIGMTGPPGV